jgi:hypothetical protein
MTNIFKFPPAGLRDRNEWVLQRRFGRQIRDAIVGLSRDHSFDPETFLIAAKAYNSGIETLCADEAFRRRGQMFCRLARAYVRKFHRELVAYLALARMAARHTLLGGAPCQISA